MGPSHPLLSQHVIVEVGPTGRNFRPPHRLRNKTLGQKPFWHIRLVEGVCK